MPKHQEHEERSWTSFRLPLAAAKSFSTSLPVWFFREFVILSSLLCLIEQSQ
ncbi:MAG: hypothetical protein ACHQ2F_00070 [Desulfobaccales bacterium]